MGVRSHAAAPPPRARPSGPGAGATLVVVLVALVLLLASGRPVGTPDPSGAASWLLRGGIALVGLAFQLDAAGEALVGKALAALFAALAAGILFAAVVRRQGLEDARWAGWLLALGTTLAAAAQAWSGEAAATCAVAVAVLLLVRSETEEDPGPAARAGLPLGLAVALQPTTVALAVVLVAAVLSRWRRRGLPVLAWAVPGALVALAGLGSAASTPPPATGLLPGLALLASPAKGALVFAPVAVVGIVGLLRALRPPARRLWDQPSPGRFLPIACGLAVVAHFTWLAAVGGWAAGDFWGPRLVAPAWPLLLLFVPEGFAVLGVGASLLALVSVAVQALGAVTYDGRWDRLHPGPAGGAATWDVERSPIVFQARERVARMARPGLEGRRLVVRERVVAPSGASGSFLSFAKTPLGPTGVDATMSAVRLEAGARAVAGRLELKAPGDGLGFRVPEGARPRRLEIRIAGRGTGTLGLGESDFAKETRWRERAVSGSFRFRLPYYHPESRGPDLRVTLRSGGPIAIESIALVPPADPENILRLP
ncbi:MAG TPA: hypothetical protein VE359_01745 [Vicinamibacteria bacterium]|nr:hypothetical protein [Vicinamibacteria bacterium]